MCGLVGIVHLDARPVELPVLAHMAAALDHRGPDAEGHLIHDGVGLYHKRLAIIDIEHGRQPMTIDGVTIVFNGEIYNYVELREELRARGHDFRTESDTEVLLRMYLEYGTDCVSRLNGMFAFLVHDAGRRLVFAARDHLGIKPLYFRRTAEHVLFASEIKALLRHPDVRAGVNSAALDEYVTFQFVLGDDTLFEGIHKLLPGHYLVIRQGGDRGRAARYWEPHYGIDDGRSEADFSAELRHLIEDAVRLQLRSDVPVGAHLSGGMDSSVLTALASTHGPLDTFTGAFDEGRDFDEREHAREVVRATGARGHEVVPTVGEFVDLLPRLVYHLDEPAAGPGVFPQFIVSRLAAKHVKVVLGGQGGDEIFGGYTRYLVAYLEQVLKGAIFETNEEREHIVSLASILPNLPALRQYVPMLKGFWRDEVFEPMDRRYFRLIDRGAGTAELLSADWRTQYDRERIFGRFQRVFNRPDTLSYFNKMTHFDMVASLPALLHVEDRVSMAVSLESRVPLLDHRIVDLVGSMPPRMKFKGGEMKHILRRAVSDLLPPGVLGRKDKMGFPVPLHLWGRGGAKEFFEDVLLSRSARERGLFDPAAVAAQIASEQPFSRRLWGLLNLELWHRTFIDGPSPSQPLGQGQHASESAER